MGRTLSNRTMSMKSKFVFLSTITPSEDIWSSPHSSSCFATSFLHFWYIMSPYKPLNSRFMIPMKWPKQKHHHSKDIDTNIKHSCEKPFFTILTITVKHQEIEWYCVISELYQWSWYKNSSSSQKVCQYPYFASKFPCLEKSSSYNPSNWIRKECLPRPCTNPTYE